MQNNLVHSHFYVFQSRCVCDVRLLCWQAFVPRNGVCDVIINVYYNSLFCGEHRCTCKLRADTLTWHLCCVEHIYDKRYFGNFICYLLAVQCPPTVSIIIELRESLQCVLCLPVSVHANKYGKRNGSKRMAKVNKVSADYLGLWFTAFGVCSVSSYLSQSSCDRYSGACRNVRWDSFTSCGCIDEYFRTQNSFPACRMRRRLPATISFISNSLLIPTSDANKIRSNIFPDFLWLRGFGIFGNSERSTILEQSKTRDIESGRSRHILTTTRQIISVDSNHYKIFVQTFSPENYVDSRIVGEGDWTKSEKIDSRMKSERWAVWPPRPLLSPSSLRLRSVCNCDERDVQNWLQ